MFRIFEQRKYGDWPHGNEGALLRRLRDLD
jgi:hypothetical protein